MGCPEPRLLDALAAGTCAPDQALAIERHLVECGACRAELAARRTVPDPTPVHEPRAAGTLPFGAAIGRYLILEQLGRGGMGVVYAAYDPKLDRRVALKVLRPERGGGGWASQARSRLLREAQAMAKLAHPNVLPVFDVGVVAGDVFVAMELVPGLTLQRWLAEPRAVGEILDVFIQAGRGLAAAHKAGIAHRDFKPTNVLVGADGRARVLDFGLAKATGDETITPRIPPESASGPALDDPSYETPTLLTTAGLVVGTPAYMAPEQHQGRADARSDEFSFCVALYEALYGAHPYPASSKEERELRFARAKVAFPASVRVPLRVRSALARGLSVDPAQRFPSMDALLSALGGRPTWRAAAAGGLLVAVLSLATFLAVRSHRGAASSLCAGAERDLAGIWDPARKEAMRHAFAATGRPYAASTWAAAERKLDAYAGEWADLRTRICEATHVRKTEPEPIFATRMACLDDRLDELRTLGDLLVTADAEAVDRALAAVAQLEPLEPCATTTGPSPDEDPAARDPAEVQRRKALGDSLDRATFLFAAGRNREALDLVQQVAAAPELAGDPALRAQSQSLLGRIQASFGRVKESEQAAAAACIAAEQAHDDAAVALAWLDLVDLVVDHDRARLADADLWVGLAAVAVQRSDARSSLEQRLASSHAGLLTSEGKYREALPLAKEALEDAEATYGVDSVEAANEALGVADAENYLGNYDGAEALYSRAVDTIERLLGPDHPELATPLGDMAATEVELGHYDRAAGLLERELALVERLDGSRGVRLIDPLHNLATVLLNEGRLSEAATDCLRAVDIATTYYGKDHPEIADQLLLLAMIYSSEKDLAKALATVDQALAIDTRFADQRAAAVIADRIERGRLLTASHQLAEARAELERARAAAVALNGPDSPAEHDALVALGDIDEANGDYAAAIATDQQAEAITERTAGPSSYLVADDVGSLGTLDMEAGHPERAAPLFERALAIRDVPGAPPADLALPRFSLARALWESGGDRGRAVTLALQARSGYATAGPTFADKVAEIDAWVETHRPPASAGEASAPSPASPSPMSH